MCIDEIVLATDCDEIENTAKSFGFEKLTIYKRVYENAQDHSSTESVMLEYLDSSRHDEKSVFILVQATSPFTTASNFTNALNQFKEEGCNSMLSCALTHQFIWNKEGRPLNYDFSNRPRRQDFEGTLIENGAFYISRVKDILDSKNRLSGKIGIYKMPEYTSIELDEPMDWIRAEAIMWWLMK